MPRPRCCRRIAQDPTATLFKPAGVRARMLDEVVLGVDGLEALRLADLEGLYQEEAAVEMGVSRATFGRIVEEARRTVATALVNGLVLRIEGGPVRLDAGYEPDRLSEQGGCRGRGGRGLRCRGGRWRQGQAGGSRQGDVR